MLPEVPELLGVLPDVPELLGVLPEGPELLGVLPEGPELLGVLPEGPELLGVLPEGPELLAVLLLEAVACLACFLVAALVCQPQEQGLSSVGLKNEPCWHFLIAVIAAKTSLLTVSALCQQMRVVLQQDSEADRHTALFLGNDATLLLILRKTRNNF